MADITQQLRNLNNVFWFLTLSRRLHEVTLSSFYRHPPIIKDDHLTRIWLPHLVGCSLVARTSIRTLGVKLFPDTASLDLLHLAVLLRSVPLLTSLKIAERSNVDISAVDLDNLCMGLRNAPSLREFSFIGWSPDVDCAGILFHVLDSTNDLSSLSLEYNPPFISEEEVTFADEWTSKLDEGWLTKLYALRYLSLTNAFVDAVSHFHGFCGEQLSLSLFNPAVQHVRLNKAYSNRSFEESHLSFIRTTMTHCLTVMDLEADDEINDTVRNEISSYLCQCINLKALRLLFVPQSLPSLLLVFALALPQRHQIHQHYYFDSIVREGEQFCYWLETQQKPKLEQLRFQTWHNLAITRPIFQSSMGPSGKTVEELCVNRGVSLLFDDRGKSEGTVLDWYPEQR
ncbi:hypothetical protein BT69DRAFT_614946 [Atractiella rhizophila]|nr:hypothetical protein BT69DRAFT_614946 [Atractiella rhizophila]